MSERGRPSSLVVLELDGRRVTMDTARYVDARTKANDVVAASAVGVLSARLMAPTEGAVLIKSRGRVHA